MTADAGPSGYRRVPLPEALQRGRIIAVLGAANPDRTDAAADILAANGIRCLQLTLAAPGALDSLERLAARLPAGTDVGLGAVMTPQDAVRAAGAGARFITSPTAAPDVIHASRNLELASCPGALTPSEVHLAWRAGASAVSLFPAGPLGPDYLAAVRAALPDIALIPSGSLDYGGTAPWFAAGATAVTLGRDLLRDSLLPGGDLAALAQRVRRVIADAEPPRP